MEGKLSMGSFSPNSISFNDNAIVSNYFYPKKFHSLKLFKDLPPTWRKFAYDHLLLEQALDLCQACISFWLQRNWANKLLYCWSFPLLLSRKSWSKSYERRLSCDLVDFVKTFGTETTKTFIRSGSSLENHIRFQTKMGKMFTRFRFLDQNGIPSGAAYTYLRVPMGSSINWYWPKNQ